MKRGRLIAIAGTVIIASASPLVAGVPAAFAAGGGVITQTENGCTFSVQIDEEHNDNGAFVNAYVTENTCHLGIEAAIKGPGKSPPTSFGNDVTNTQVFSGTGTIPVSSGNHHGIRVWFSNMWNPFYVD